MRCHLAQLLPYTEQFRDQQLDKDLQSRNSVPLSLEPNFLQVRCILSSIFVIIAGSSEE